MHELAHLDEGYALDGGNLFNHVDGDVGGQQSVAQVGQDVNPQVLKVGDEFITGHLDEGRDIYLAVDGVGLGDGALVVCLGQGNQAVLFCLDGWLRLVKTDAASHLVQEHQGRDRHFLGIGYALRQRCQADGHKAEQQRKTYFVHYRFHILMVF